MSRKAKGNKLQGWGTRRGPGCCPSGKPWLSSGSITWTAANGIELASWALPWKGVVRNSCCKLRKAHRESGACGMGRERSGNNVDQILAAGPAPLPASQPITWLARCLPCLSSASLLLQPPHVARKNQGLRWCHGAQACRGMNSRLCYEKQDGS